MTEDEAIALLTKIHRGEATKGYRLGDPELMHIKEDALLLHIIREFGWTRFADAYEEADVERWYA